MDVHLWQIRWCLGIRSYLAAISGDLRGMLCGCNIFVNAIENPKTWNKNQPQEFCLNVIVASRSEIYLLGLNFDLRIIV